MKLPIHFIFCLFLANIISLHAQKTPYFLTTIYFEDAIGNIDSMEVGFDTAAGKFNTEWGEVLNTEPFDSIFDVRAIHGHGFQNWESNNLLIKKRIVVGAEKVSNAPCLVGYPLYFVIKAKYEPITIWCKNPYDFLKISCDGLIRNMLVPDSFYERIAPWEWKSSNPIYGCINDGPFTWFIRPKPMQYLEAFNYIFHPSLENKKDTIYGILLSSSFVNYWCDTTAVANKEIIDEANMEHFKIYPNPAENYLVVESLKYSMLNNIQIYTASGNLIQSQKISIFSKTYKMDLENYLPGLYIIRVGFTDGRQSFQKFIKN